MKRTRISKGLFTFTMAVCALVILMASVEAIRNITDLDAFETLKGIMTEENRDFAFEAFRQNVMMLYFIRIIPFVGFGINMALAYYRTGFSRVFNVVWSMVLLGTLVLHILSRDFRNFYYYVYIIGHILLIGSLFRINSAIVKDKERED